MDMLRHEIYSLTMKNWVLIVRKIIRKNEKYKNIHI